MSLCCAYESDSRLVSWLVSLLVGWLVGKLAS